MIQETEVLNLFDVLEGRSSRKSGFIVHMDPYLEEKSLNYLHLQLDHILSSN